jgi:hypothetical protein
MASNSTINPAPSVITNIFNPELWNDTDKAITTISPLPDDPVSLGGAGRPTDNTMTGQNTYNAPINYTADFPIMRDFKWFLLGAVFLSGQTTLSEPLSSIYLWDLTTIGNKTITFPNASVDLEGVSITFRRHLIANYQLLSASPNINNISSLTDTHVILDANVITTIITCAYNGSSYQWFATYSKS